MLPPVFLILCLSHTTAHFLYYPSIPGSHGALVVSPGRVRELTVLPCLIYEEENMMKWFPQSPSFKALTEKGSQNNVATVVDRTRLAFISTGSG